MAVRKRKKNPRMRGHRTRHGNTKNRRGAGCRGGRGKAGSHKHKYSKYWMVFGTKIRLKAKEKEKAINLDEFERIMPELIKKGIVSAEGKKVIVEGKKFPYSKILGRGNISFLVELNGVKASKKAKEKIEKKGGKA